MEQIINELRKDRVFENFYKISQIPRGSFHEKEISDYLVTWAKERNLYVIQDSFDNVFIRKEATKGYESVTGVILQAHMDMVCEKIPDYEHDFRKDPIPWVIEDDWLSTGGKTTLGADDGIGVALAMAILEEEKLEHPMLEVLFTVAEEETLAGAIGFDTDYMKGRYLINLDHVNSHEIICGSCGGEALEVMLPVLWEDLSDDYAVYQLRISGLKGGHSGDDIHLGHGNANRLLARILSELDEMQIKLCALKGGTFRLAIPRDATCAVAIPKNQIQKAKERIEILTKQLKREYQSAADSMQIEFLPSKITYQKMCDGKDFISFVLCAPDGVYEMNADMIGIVNSSDNLGEMYLEDNQFRVVFEIRSAYNTSRDHIAYQITCLAKEFKGRIEIHSVYPSWMYCPDSQLLAKAIDVFEEKNGNKPKVYSVHAGLECGCFYDTKPDLEAISVGPDCEGLHSPDERLRISSTKEFYEILKDLIRKIKE